MNNCFPIQFSQLNFKKGDFLRIGTLRLVDLEKVAEILQGKNSKIMTYIS